MGDLRLIARSIVIILISSLLLLLVWASGAPLSITSVDLTPSSPSSSQNITCSYTGAGEDNATYAWGTDRGTIKFWCTFNNQSNDCGDYYNFTSFSPDSYSIDSKGTYGINFTSGSAYIDGASNSGTFEDQNFTYIMSLTHADVGYDQYYFKRGMGTSPYTLQYVRCDYQSGPGCFVSFRVGNSTNQTFELDMTEQIVAGQTYHFAFVKDGDNISIYQDGILNVSAIVDPLYPLQSKAGDLQIGNSNGGNEFNGTMDDFEYYDYALTPNAVYEHFIGNTKVNFADTSGGENYTCYVKLNNATHFVQDSATATVAQSTDYYMEIYSVSVSANQTTPGAELSCAIVAGNYSEIHQWWNTPDGSLIAYYPFSNASAYDITGNGNDGSVTGATYSDELSAYTFDGSSDYITIPNLSMDYSNFSISLWMNTSDTNNQENIFSHGRDAYADSDNGFELHYYLVGEDDKLQATIYQDGTRAYLNYFPAGYDDGDMHHIVMTGRNGGQSLWVDGVEVATDNELFTTFTVSSHAYLGAGLVNNNNWVGTIDNVQIYERVLTDEEIISIYSNGRNPNSTSVYLNATATTSEGEYICYVVASDLNSYSALSSDSVSLSESSATEYYIDSVGGDDSNTGIEPTSAWKTLQKFEDTSIPTGSNLWLFANSSFLETFIIDESNLIIKKYAGGTNPEITGGVDLSSSGNWTVSGTANIYNSSASSQDMEYLWHDNTGCILVNNTGQLDSDWECWMDDTNNRVLVYHSSGSPDTQATTITANSLRTGTGSALVYTTGDNLMFDGIDIHHAGIYGFRPYLGDNITFKNGDLSWNWDKTVWTDRSNNIVFDNYTILNGSLEGFWSGSNGENLFLADGAHFTITNGLIDGAGGAGINGYRCDYLYAFNNTVRNSRHNPYYDALPGIYPEACNNSLVIQNNVTNFTVGISSNAEASGDRSENVTYKQNLLDNNYVAVVFRCNSGDKCLQDITFDHNTIYQKDDPPYNDHIMWIDDIDNLTFTNNIIHEDWDKRKSGNNLVTWYGGADVTNYTFDYNLWYQSNSSYSYYTTAYDSTFIGYQTEINDEWNSTNQSAQFVNSTAKDFRPLTDTIACNMSTTDSYVGAFACEEPLTDSDTLSLADGSTILFIDKNNSNCDNSYTRTQALVGTTPWCDLDGATKAEGGDTVYIKGAEYSGEFEIRGIEMDGDIIISGYPRENPVFVRNESCDSWTNISNSSMNLWTCTTSESHLTSYVRADFKNNTRFFTWINMDDFNASDYPYNIYSLKSSKEIWLKFSDMTFNPNDEDIYLLHDYPPIRIGDNVMNGHTLTIKNITLAHSMIGMRLYNASNVVLDTITCHGGYECIVIDGQDVAGLENITIQNSLFNGHIGNWSGDDMKYESNAEETSAIYGEGYAGAVYIHDNNFTRWHGAVLLNSQTASEFDGSLVYNNTFTKGAGSQIEIEDYCSNTKYLQNKIFDSQMGLSIGSGKAAQSSPCYVEYNQVILTGQIYNDPGDYDDSYCFKIYNNPATTGENVSWFNITHNTFACKGRAVYHILEAGRYNATRNMTFMDNIYYSVDSFASLGTGQSELGNFYDYNLYHTNYTYLFSRYDNDEVADTYTTLAAAQASSYWDGVWDINSVDDNPLFSDWAGYNVTPTSGSPACAMSSTGDYVGALACESAAPSDEDYVNITSLTNTSQTDEWIFLTYIYEGTPDGGNLSFGNGTVICTFGAGGSCAGSTRNITGLSASTSYTFNITMHYGTDEDNLSATFTTNVIDTTPTQEEGGGGSGGVSSEDKYTVVVTILNEDIYKDGFVKAKIDIQNDYNDKKDFHMLYYLLSPNETQYGEGEEIIPLLREGENSFNRTILMPPLPEEGDWAFVVEIDEEKQKAFDIASLLSYEEWKKDNERNKLVLFGVVAMAIYIVMTPRAIGSRR